MERINFSAGNERRFADFISGLSDKDKIALISHTDLDGIAAAKITHKVINADVIKFVNYEEINTSLIDELKKNKVNTIIFTDLFLRDLNFIKELEKFSKILVIDHHLIETDYNSNKTFFINAQGYCATYLCYYLLSKIQNIESFDWLAACASLSDWMWFENKKWLNEVYEKYGDIFLDDLKKVKSGKMWELTILLNNSIVYFNKDLKKVFDSIGERFGDVGDLSKYAPLIEEEIQNSLKMFEKEKLEIKGGYYWNFNPKFNIGSTISTILGTNNPSNLLVITRPSGEICHVSARRSDKKDNMKELLKKLTDGFENSDSGGHAGAAGGHFPIKYLEEFKNRLKKL
jgi:single-stranded DNA-specific DHH superfamily exonuclease